MCLHGTALGQEAERFACSLAVRGGASRMLAAKVVLPNYSSITSMVEWTLNFQPYNLPCCRQRLQLVG